MDETATSRQARQQQAERQAARLDLHVLPLRHRTRRPPAAAQQGRLQDPARGRGGTHRGAHALATGAYVKAERISLASFLTDEWLPSRRPPVLEESTWHSYDRYLRLHVIPHIGAIPLQKLSPSTSTSSTAGCSNPGGTSPAPRPGDQPEVRERAVELRAGGLTLRTVAEQLRDGVRGRGGDHQERRRRSDPRADAPSASQDDPPAGLAPRTVRYIHTIIHAALKDALRWNRVVRNVADAATPPSAAAARSHRPKAWTAEQLRAFLDYAADSHLPAGVDLPRHERLPARRVPRPPLGRPRPRRGDGDHLPPGDRARPPGHREGAAEDEAGAPHPPRLRHGRDAPSAASRAGRERSSALGPGYHDEGYVFCQFDGRPHHPERFSREFDRKQQLLQPGPPRQQLPTITLHGLRHTWATLALSAGIDIKIVSERLNHSSTHITREIYTHVTPPMQSDAAERVANLIRGS